MNILLICSSGMSTSLVVSRMLKAAKEQGKTHHIWAVSMDCAIDHYKQADMILLGPQISNIVNEIRQESKKPVYVINRENYGKCRGDVILAEAEERQNGIQHALEEV